MKKRLFIAVKLNQSILDVLRVFQLELKKELPFKGIRWVDPTLFHLTLQFLGDTETNQIEPLVANLEAASKKVNPFDLVFNGAGYFGSSTSVRVIWAGTQPSAGLRNLYKLVIQSTEFLDTEQHPRYSPHLTIARMADWLTSLESSRIAEVITEKNSCPFGTTKINSFELIESNLNPNGPVYKTVRLFNLV